MIVFKFLENESRTAAYDGKKMLEMVLDNAGRRHVKIIPTCDFAHMIMYRDTKHEDLLYRK